MKLQKFRWSKVYESQEEELVRLLASKNLAPTTQDVAEFAEHTITTDTDSTLWCAEGSFKLVVDGQSMSMQPGDALPIPVNMKLIIQAGMSGCTLYLTPNNSRVTE